MLNLNWKWILPVSWLLLWLAAVRLLGPGLSDLWQSAGSLIDTAGKIESASNLKAEIISLRIASRQTQQQIADMLESMPNSGQLSALYKALGEAAEESGVTIQQIKPLPARDASTYQELDLAINVDGQYWRLLRFLHDLEGKKRLFRVHHLTLYTKSQRNKHISAELGLRAFLR